MKLLRAALSFLRAVLATPFTVPGLIFLGLAFAFSRPAAALAPWCPGCPECEAEREEEERAWIGLLVPWKKARPRREAWTRVS